MKKRITIGLMETVVLENGREYKAKIDTGADTSSVDESIISKMNKEVDSHKTVRSSLGEAKRPTVILKLTFHEQDFEQKFTVADRSNLKYKVLIGKDILRKGNFLIDPCK
ncbi:ATP-dependent zinc protease [Candidatus Woesearchaeota archaeon]|nr:ATP-dependent zinc protease [Candidatus Woesearchaeota archaeon]USN43945.1 MAG: ATP-dependent zinc protease [Candidatus Woesearchaeota archaeon]